MNAWEKVAMTEVLLMVPVVTAFVILYGCYWPWYRSAQGRALFTAKLGMALLVDFAALYKVLENYLPPKEVTATFVYAIILAGQAGLLIALLLSWHTRHDRHADDENERSGRNETEHAPPGPGG